MISFIDIETTGLDERRDLILEVGWITVTDDLTQELSRGSFVTCHCNKLSFAYAQADEKVRRMHQESGLWQEIRENGRGWPVLTEFAEAVKGGVLGGFSPHFDRKFMRRQLPNVEASLHYRNFCCSTLRHLLKQVGAPFEQGPAKHRALADCEQALAVARQAQAVMSLGARWLQA